MLLFYTQAVYYHDDGSFYNTFICIQNVFIVTAAAPADRDIKPFRYGGAILMRKKSYYKI